METIGAYEAKTNLAQLLKRVAQGEKITITKHGVPVAVLHPPESAPSHPAKDVITALRAFRRKHDLNGLSVRQMINEGRR